jgi:hypothetical protein
MGLLYRREPFRRALEPSQSLNRLSNLPSHLEKKNTGALRRLTRLSYEVKLEIHKQEAPLHSY